MIKRLLSSKKIRFLLVGGLNTAIGYGSYALFLLIGLNPYIATTLSTIIGVINSYFWNKHYTFKTKAKSLSEVVRFVSVYIVSYLLNMLLVYILVDLLNMNPYLTGAICLFVVTIISYVGHNYFSFKQKKEEGDSQIET